MHLNIKPIAPVALTPANAWPAGFFDAAGTVAYTFKGRSSPQLTLSVSSKQLCALQHYSLCFGGGVYFDQSQNGYYTWAVQSEPALQRMLAYFERCPSRSAKAARLRLVPQYFTLTALKAYDPQSALHKAWCKFDTK
jgi:hypothetical protein